MRRTSRRADLSGALRPGQGRARLPERLLAREPPAAYPVMVSRIAGTTCLIREKKLTGSGTAGRAHEQNVLACRDLGPRTGDLALKETDGPRGTRLTVQSRLRKTRTKCA